MAAANYFSNDTELPNFKLGNLPKIKTNLPRIQMRGDSDLLFEIDGQSIGLDEVAEKFSNFFFSM